MGLFGWAKRTLNQGRSDAIRARTRQLIRLARSGEPITEAQEALTTDVWWALEKGFATEDVSKLVTEAIREEGLEASDVFGDERLRDVIAGAMTAAREMR